MKWFITLATGVNLIGTAAILLQHPDLYRWQYALIDGTLLLVTIASWREDRKAA